MKRFIFDIQYNENDSKELIDRVWVDAISKNAALRKLDKQFPGVFAKYLVKFNYEYIVP